MLERIAIRRFLLTPSVFVFFLMFSGANLYAFCFEEAGERYGLNPSLLKAIAKVESSFNPVALNFNKNGTVDYGLMQINSSWKKTLGEDLWQAVLFNPCTNVMVGGWVLAMCVHEHGYNWIAVGCYHSPEFARRVDYTSKVYHALVNSLADEASRFNKRP